MTAVGCRIDQDIVRLRLHTAFDDGLQELVLDLKFFERKIIHVDDELVIAVLDLGDDRREILELVLVDLDHAQALRIELVDDRLDARGFTGTAVAEQQDVVRRFPSQNAWVFSTSFFF